MNANEDDEIFRLPLEDQRYIVMRLLDVADDYPMMGTIDFLLAVLRHHGQTRFNFELMKIKKPETYDTICSILGCLPPLCEAVTGPSS